MAMQIIQLPVAKTVGASDEWAYLMAVIAAAGGNSAEVKRRASLDGVSVEVVAATFIRHLRYIKEMGVTVPQFEHLEALPPGVVDLRVFDQDVWWVDVLRRPHVIADMSLNYLDNVVGMLILNVAQYFAHYYANDPREANWVDMSIWLESTPPMVALRDAIATQRPTNGGEPHSETS